MSLELILAEIANVNIVSRPETLTNIPIRIHCHGCGESFELVRLHLITKCPRCGNKYAMVSEGDLDAIIKKWGQIFADQLTKAAARLKNTKLIPYLDKPMIVGCDGHCNLAWGIQAYGDRNVEPRSIDLGPAPGPGETPIMYEGNDAKPMNDAEFPNKWCVRQCERCESINPRKPRR